MGFGVDLDEDVIEDVELASTLRRASALVDAYCAAPQIPQPHSFAGGAITGEQHKWSVGTDTRAGSRRVYVYHRPIKHVDNFAIKVTNTIKVTVGPSDIYINNSEGYIELVSLAAVTYGIYPIGIIPNLGLHTPVVELDYEYGYEAAVTSESLYATDGLTYRTGNGFLKPSAVSVYNNGTAVTSGFSIDHEDGSVLFASPPSGVVTANYTYLVPRAIAQATGEIAADMLAERALAEKGMRRLAAITMAEIELRRTLQGTNVSTDITSFLPQSAIVLLEPYRFRSVG